MVTALKPRCEADSRPLCALLASVAHHLVAQLGDTVDAYTFHTAARAGAVQASKEALRVRAELKSATSGPNQARAEGSKCCVIGCQSVRPWLSFLGLRTVVRA
jgi:hypothetical protein